MTKTKAKEWLKAVRYLAAYYRGEHDECKYTCPLCTVAKKDRGCQDCLWVLFSKMTCIGYRDLHSFGSAVMTMRIDRNPRWVKLSLARLKGWEKRLVEFIEKIDDMKSRRNIFFKKKLLKNT